MRSLFASLALSLALSLAVAAPAALSAQTATDLAAVPVAPVVAPAMAPAVTPAAQAPSMVRSDVAGVQTDRQTAADHTVNSAAAAGGLHQGEGVALMAVGGAALVAGLLIGNSAGTAVAIGGLAVGLVGLYEYVR